MLWSFTVVLPLWISGLFDWKGQAYCVVWFSVSRTHELHACGAERGFERARVLTSRFAVFDILAVLGPMWVSRKILKTAGSIDEWGRKG